MFIIPTEARRDSEYHFGSGDAQTQSANDEAELQEQPREDDVDEEKRNDPLDWEKMKVGLYFQLIADILTKGFIEMFVE